MKPKTALIVLGYRLNDDGSANDILRDRVKKAVGIYTKDMPELVVLSGGLANKKTAVSEAAVMKGLIDDLIPKEKILLEEKSKTTKQNAYFSVKAVAEKGVERIIICSSTKHLNRFYLNPYRLFKREASKYGIVVAKSFCD